MALPDTAKALLKEAIEQPSGNGSAAPTDSDSVQFRAEGQPANGGYEMAGVPIRIFSDAEELPPWWSPARDIFLRKQLANNAFMSGIVYGETTRVKNTPWVLVDETGGATGKVSEWQQLLATANFGQGFRSLLQSVALDLLTQDNGAFIELIGPGEVTEIEKTFGEGQAVKFTAKGERTGSVKGLSYIDAGQVWRTYDPEYPVIYTDPFYGTFTVLHWTRVVALSQFEQGYELGRKIGMCALSRSYEMARLVSAMHTYQYEKITGQQPEIFFTSSPTSKLQDALSMNYIANMNKGFGVFKDSVIVGPKSGGVGSKDFRMEKLGLRDVGDGFDYESQLNQAVFIAALAFGIDAREIWPATSSGATKADAEIQHMKATGKGRADIMQMVEDAINWRVFPPEVTFKFDLIDDLEDKQKAEIAQIRAETRAVQIASLELSADEARQMAAQHDDINPAFLGNRVVADDTTDAAVMSDNQPAKPAPPDAAQKPAADPEKQDEQRIEKKKIGIKRYSRSRSQFFLTMLGLVEDATNGFLSRREFSQAARKVVKEWFSTGFVDGLREGAGNADVEPDEDEMAIIDDFIKEQVAYVGGLTAYVYSGEPDINQQFDRVSMWVRKGFDMSRNIGLVTGRDNKMLVWRLGLTEQHCATCLYAAGQVHRAKDWERSGIMPRADILECHGFHCDCDLEPTTDRAKGRLAGIPTFVGTERIRIRMR